MDHIADPEMQSLMQREIVRFQSKELPKNKLPILPTNTAVTTANTDDDKPALSVAGMATK